MRSSIVSVALLALALGRSAVASEVPEFSAYLHLGREELFLFGDLGKGQSSDWLRVGDAFGGYSVRRYDKESSSVVLEKDGMSITVPLRTAKVLEASGAQDSEVEVTKRLKLSQSVLQKMRLRLRSAHPAVKAQMREIEELERRLAKQRGAR